MNEKMNESIARDIMRLTKSGLDVNATATTYATDRCSCTWTRDPISTNWRMWQPATSITHAHIALVTQQNDPEGIPYGFSIDDFGDGTVRVRIHGYGQIIAGEAEEVTMALAICNALIDWFARKEQNEIGD